MNCMYYHSLGYHITRLYSKVFQSNKVQVKTSKYRTEYKIVGGEWFPMLMCGTMLATVFVPYFIILVRGTLNPILPFVSQVSGSPPQSGVFNILIVLSSLLAFLGLHLLHMRIRTLKKRIKDEWVRYLSSLLNNISLVPGHLGIIGMIIVGSFPIDAHRSSEEWTKVTIIPHAIGAISLFLGGVFYCILITYILSLIHPEQKQILGIRIFLICLITMCSALQGYTVNNAFWPSGYKELFKGCVVEPDFIPYNMSYLISSVSEWSLILAFIVFFTTLKDEAKDVCFIMAVAVGEEANSEEPPKKDENSNLGVPAQHTETTEKQS